MHKLKDAFIPTVFFSNLIIFTLVILYRYFMPKVSKKVTKKSQLLFSLPHICCVAIYITFISISVSQFANHDLQYYRMLNIKRQYTADQVAKANRKILRDLHPDSAGGDQNKYMIHTETMEAFKKMPKSLLRIYNMFNEDVYMLFTESTPEVSFKNFHSKKENDSFMLHGFALLLSLFVVKFSRIQSQKVKTSVLVSFVASFLVEAVFFDYFQSFGDYQRMFLDFVGKTGYFDQFTFYEVFFAVKISVFFLQQLGVVLLLPIVVDKPMAILSFLDELEENLEDSLWLKSKFNKSEGGSTGSILISRNSISGTPEKIGTTAFGCG